jgi:hypothetical protein
MPTAKEGEKNAFTCHVCETEIRNVVLSPCNHVYFCEKCFDTYTNKMKKEKCPICPK